MHDFGQMCRQDVTILRPLIADGARFWIAHLASFAMLKISTSLLSSDKMRSATRNRT